MKAFIVLLLTILMSFCSVCHAQTNQTADSSKQKNLIDEQVKMYGSIFEMAGAGESNPLGGATNYKQLIESMDLPQDLKKTILEQYKVYDLSLDPAKKDSLKIAVGKMLNNAIEKSRNDPNN